MPELPEVETVRRGLAPTLEGVRLRRVEARRADLRLPIPKDLSARLEGSRVVGLHRRSKYLLAEMETGTVLVLHLGMSGRVRVELPSGTRSALGVHDHLVIETEHGARIVLNDARRFGLVLLCDRDALEVHPLFAHLGPEPLGNEFSGPALHRRLQGRRTSLKAALLDQRVVAGIGNIYACEALHRAHLSPRRMAYSLGLRRVDRLADAIRRVLEEAIDAGGSTLRDHAQVTGELGYFQAAFRVYGRTDACCLAAGCGGRVARIVQNGRSTFYCGDCQR